MYLFFQRWLSEDTNCYYVKHLFKINNKTNIKHCLKSCYKFLFQMNNKRRYFSGKISGGSRDLCTRSRGTNWRWRRDGPPDLTKSLNQPLSSWKTSKKSMLVSFVLLLILGDIYWKNQRFIVELFIKT